MSEGGERGWSTDPKQFNYTCVSGGGSCLLFGFINGQKFPFQVIKIITIFHQKNAWFVLFHLEITERTSWIFFFFCWLNISPPIGSTLKRRASLNVHLIKLLMLHIKGVKTKDFINYHRIEQNKHKMFSSESQPMLSNH